MADDGFHEIQLGRKQLFFAFLAGTVLLILVFIIGVWVGRGVPKPDAELAADAPAADLPLTPGATPPPTQVSPGELDYSKLLDAEGRSAVERPAAKATEPPTPPDADTSVAVDPKPAATTPAAAKAEAPKTEPAPSTPKPATKAAAVSPFMLQVGAFAQKSAADALVANLTKKGYPAMVVSAANTPTPYKVRVGPYTDRPTADAVSARLKKDGFSPLITR